MEQAKLEKLSQFINFLTDEGVTKAEFLKHFKKVIEQVLKIETKALHKINQTIDELKKDNQSLKESTQANLNSLAAELNQAVTKALKEQENGMNFVYDKVRKIRDGKAGRDGMDGQPGRDGKDADETKIIEELLKKTEIPEIDTTKLDELKQEVEELKARPRLGGGGFSKIHMEGHILDPYTPTGDVNGTNKDFTLSHIPNPATSLKVYVNGMKMQLTGDYTVSGKTVSMVIAPPTSSIIEVEHRK